MLKYVPNRKVIKSFLDTESTNNSYRMNAMQFKDGYVNKVFSQKIGQEGKNEYYIGLYCDCDCCH